MFGDLIRSLVKETILLPVNAVKGVVDAVSETIDDLTE